MRKLEACGRRGLAALAFQPFSPWLQFAGGAPACEIHSWWLRLAPDPAPRRRAALGTRALLARAAGDGRFRNFNGKDFLLVGRLYPGTNNVAGRLSGVHSGQQHVDEIKLFVQASAGQHL